MRIIAGCDMVNTILTYKLVSNRFFLRKQSHFFCKCRNYCHFVLKVNRGIFPFKSIESGIPEGIWSFTVTGPVDVLRTAPARKGKLG